MRGRYFLVWLLCFALVPGVAGAWEVQQPASYPPGGSGSLPVGFEPSRPRWFGMIWPEVGLNTYEGDVFKAVGEVALGPTAEVPDGCGVEYVVSDEDTATAVVVQYSGTIYQTIPADALYLYMTVPDAPRFARVDWEGTKTGYVLSSSRSDATWSISSRLGMGPGYAKTGAEVDLPGTEYASNLPVSSVQGIVVYAHRPKVGGGFDWVIRTWERYDSGMLKSTGGYPSVDVVTYEATGTVTTFTDAACRVTVMGDGYTMKWKSAGYWDYGSSTAQAATTIGEYGVGYAAVTTATAEVDAVFANGPYGDFESVQSTDTTPWDDSGAPLGDLVFEDPTGLLPDWFQEFYESKLLGPMERITDELSVMFWPFAVLAGE